MNKIYYSFCLIFSLAWLAVMAASNSNITADQSALLAFKDRMITSESQKILAKNWSVTSFVCDWMGITCGSRHLRVTALNISDMNLAGTIPPQLGNLSFLVSLDIKRNNFHGELPRELAHLRRLRHLDFGINNLGGELPSWFGYLHKLQYLSLRNNSFTGSIPPSISNMSNLETLWLSHNSLEGSVPIEFQNLNNLENLIIEQNQLSGPFPLHISNISSLQAISFMSNRLSGILPDNICHGLQKLTWLGLGGNNLTGQIPSTLSQCSLLQQFSLASNHLSGSIPKAIWNLTMLEGLYLGSNNLTGATPNEIGNLTMLTILDFAVNKLSGVIPMEIGNLAWLTSLYFQSNKLTGGIPEKIGNLHRLEMLVLGDNTLSGSIPIEISNISSLQVIELYQNKFSGTIPLTMNHKLNNLETLSLYQNYLTGVIPNSISNASNLVDLMLDDNELIGSIPSSLGSLRNLQLINLGFNRLSSESSSPELSFFTSLTTCRSLRYLEVHQNPLNGFLPASFSNYSSSLEDFGAYNCKIKGSIPLGISNLSSLLYLDFSNNELIGSIPRTINRLMNLQEFYLESNQIRDVLDSFCGFQSLGSLALGQNQFFGSIPECFRNMTSLRQILLNSNMLASTIPATLLSMKDLQVLNLSSNFFSGSLPREIGNLKAIYSLDLSINKLSDVIPTTIGELQALQTLSLAKNNLQGSIPKSISNMLNLEFLDISHNNLSGTIPKSLEALKYLKEFNVSFNRLSGEIPRGGPFRSFTGQLFMNNEALCGDPRLSVPPCQSNSITKSNKRKKLLLVMLLSGIAAILMVVTITIWILRWLKKPNISSGTELMSVAKYGRFSYYELLHSTNNYNESNLIGKGSIGSVYKGILSDGIAVAIKVFNLQVEGALKSFDRECEVLKSLRHRNLTKVLGSCSNPEFKALVLKYMPNGSLETWLYSHNYLLDLIQRVNIMIDVACALEYLHYGYNIPVVHCDLKPSNILLDEDMVAHVSDFGITKMFGEGESILHTKTLATPGYIAPEYGSGGIVSTRIDVYSFGIVLMETFTRVKPTDEMFSRDLILKSWVEDSLPDAFQVIDANLIRQEDEHFTDKMKCVIFIMKLALNCCRESPGERMNMKDVLVELKKIKHQLLIISNLEWTRYNVADQIKQILLYNPKA
ncbi:probable LRR receptor-like serine/threonine-protein kinase At3g47570 isoform X2 [Coffea eugenioides]|uniref:probable LRR receptor-like serine/threonine-protein kinase At3g47570 isoform X2 n=1 Tax=Coffea eugenioides TaxID=49369 RepID=UPI000F60B92D|nr:probable LRR receptor-like serine/threonine-protein kinase At3g47570 isoform X2 [Coffea eugenioides]